MKRNHTPPTPTPPEYRLEVIICERCGASLLDFLELCTRTRHKDSQQRESALTLFLREKLGSDWYMELFRAAEPEIRMTVIEDSGDSGLKELFKARRLGRRNIKKLAIQYCDWGAALFGLSIPLDQPGGDKD